MLHGKRERSLGTAMFTARQFLADQFGLTRGGIEK